MLNKIKDEAFIRGTVPNKKIYSILDCILIDNEVAVNRVLNELISLKK